MRELEEADRRRWQRWSTEYPGGVNLGRIAVDATACAMVNTARICGHAVVCVMDGNELKLFACPR